jgi:hypothetical protein
MGERKKNANTIGAEPADTVIILISEYKQLLKDSEVWNRLERGGVNGGWDWFGESLDPRGEQTYEEFCAEVDQMFSEDDHE